MSRRARLTTVRQRRKNRARMRDSLILGGAVMAMVFGFPAIWKLFEYIDCQTATRNLEFYDRCIADDNCTLRPHELQRVEAYTRLQLARCH